jgi:hypothetical protein
MEMREQGREVRGSKFDGSLDVAEIAKRLRREIREAIKAGTLPKGLKTSVTIDRFAGGQSCDIRIKALPFPLLNPDWRRSRPASGLDLYTGQARDVLDELSRMLGAYNRDNSDSQTDYFDVHFYGHVGVHWEYEKACRAAQIADAAADEYARTRQDRENCERGLS